MDQSDIISLGLAYIISIVGIYCLSLDPYNGNYLKPLLFCGLPLFIYNFIRFYIYDGLNIDDKKNKTERFIKI